MTALAKAFDAAGYIAPDKRLQQAAMEAIQASPRNWDGAKDALFRAIRIDAELLWELFAPFRNQAVQALLTEAAAAVRAQEKPIEMPRVIPRQEGGAGRCEIDAQRESARPTTPPSPPMNPEMPRVTPRQGGGEGQVRSDDQHRNAPPASRNPTAGMEAIVSIARKSLLDRFIVNGKPIGDLTPREAIGWAGARERDARFVRMLTANLPMEEPIRKYRTGQDAADLYARAETADA